MLIVRRRGLRIALVSTGGVVAVLGLAQLLLPALAAQRVRSQLGRYGDVRSVAVSAFPAVELLWGHAQSATARAGSLTMSLAQAGALLWEGRGVDRLDVSAQSVRLESFALRDVSLVRHGSELHLEGSLTAADLRAALPGSVAVQPLGSVPGGVEVRVTGNLFGAATSLDALLSVEDGRLVAQPLGIPFAGALRLTLLSAPHLYLQNFALTSLPSAGGTGGGSAGGRGGDTTFLVTLSAQLR
jgi:hypothetical protein